MLGFVSFGILIMQCFIYYTRFTNDLWWLKLFVWCIAFLECLSFAFTVYQFWLGASLECLACVVAVNEVTWPMGVLIILAGLIASLVHTFYCWRIWIMAKSLVVPCVAMLLSLVQFSFAVVEGLTLIHPGGQDVGLTIAHAISSTWVIGSCLCDIIITIHTIRLLLKKKSGTKFKRTQFLVVKLVKLTIETGMVTVAVTLIAAVFLFVNFWSYYSIFTFLSALYANCLLASLNARILIQNSSNHCQVSTLLFDGHGGEIEGSNDNDLNATPRPFHNPEILPLHRQSAMPLERVLSSDIRIGGSEVVDDRSKDNIPTIISLPPIHHDARQWEMTSLPWVDR
ncbi:hypothetical protein SERLA73DRAFT_159494 [Serpula lacrymans var. lacrymans S7.3]|uniref:DUF6534 domain-containing protein n=2 Tax=Serpula lacrymans var. lacrymans TaxID=341189 RepID=F8PSY5_SERL3|nr:uncharacterized protein SERLADRAFT_414496 [Serpula lacrymans var. lacrymans S7.9]EGO00843.1 hypothetical protein SERLA73DRAFT_159494 [Serpula lacrymans var. lacrymans S7.3]EGO26466.1 hypothetical protein SERLADRAFT_414496 [Serpula lacrymans var. lacrymans S7.9]